VELPAALRQAVERELDGVPLDELRRAADSLSRRYRDELRDGSLHLSGQLAVGAYLATRLPATYAAIRAAIDSAAAALPDFEPRSLLDIGAGPGTALWAASDRWPGLDRAALVEASAAAREVGARLASFAPLPVASWIAADVASAFPDLPRSDLVTIAYVLDELAPATRATVVDHAWRATSGVLLVVEPGTPAGWQRILAARSQLLAAGARLAAPCPHRHPCPLVAPDWCHFARRVARSRLHRLAKSAEVPWEDEKFIYLAASPSNPEPKGSRVLAPPRRSSGHATLKLCQSDGTVAERGVSKRDGETWRAARRLDWGDSFED
jgi:ribosomal protein RSM22 (predicted rRNA methylase)